MISLITLHFIFRVVSKEKANSLFSFFILFWFVLFCIIIITAEIKSKSQKRAGSDGGCWNLSMSVEATRACSKQANKQCLVYLRLISDLQCSQDCIQIPGPLLGYFTSCHPGKHTDLCPAFSDFVMAINQRHSRHSQGTNWWISYSIASHKVQTARMLLWVFFMVNLH